VTDYFTYEGDGASINPHRPGIADVGGAALADDQEKPPIPTEMPTADDWNQISKLATYSCRVLPVAVVSVSFSSGTPVCAYFQAINPNLTSTDITLTDNGNGDTSITWAAGTFPVRNLNAAGLTLNENAAIDEHMALPITNGVQVITESGGAGTDCAFTVYIHG
jgi:hypothetical protein